MQPSLAENSAAPQAPKKTVPLEEKNVPGSSMENPIVIKGAETYDKVREKQQDYIRKQYEGYKLLIDQFSLEDNQRFIQCFVLKNDEGEYVEIYFNITDICKAPCALKDKELGKRIQKAKDAAKSRSRE